MANQPTAKRPPRASADKSRRKPEVLNLAHLPVPGRQAMRPRAQTGPRKPARTVVLRLAQALLAAMRQHEEGIRRGVDPECLHRYRVLLRRLRSLITQMRQALPAEATETLRGYLQDLALRTGRLRDLDVLLPAEPAYRRMMPAALRPGLDQAFGAARRQRGLERARLSRYLLSERYAQLIDGLQETLATAADAPGTEAAAAPIGELVRKRLRRQYRRLVREAAELPYVVPDAAYHRIRIRCKRVRYLLDLFRPLLRPKPAGILLQRLAALQENLGAVNDLSVQRARLEGWFSADEAAGNGITASAMAGLRRRLDRRREVLDRRVHALLCRFCSRATAQTLKRL